VRYGAPFLLARKAADGSCSLHVLQKEPGVDRIGSTLRRSSFPAKSHTNVPVSYISADAKGINMPAERTKVTLVLNLLLR